MKKIILIFIIAILFLSFSLQVFTGENPTSNRRFTNEELIKINKELRFRIELTNFRYASWDILRHMGRKLETVSKKLKVIVDKAKEFGVYDKLKIFVIGYSDADGPFYKKLAASKKRALAVVKYLISKGFEKKIFIAKWRADRELKNPYKPKSPINRRVLIVFEGLPISVRNRNTGDRVVDSIDEMGFRDIRYFLQNPNKELKPNINNEIDIKTKGVVKITGRVISFLPGDKVFVRIRNIMTPVYVNPDGTFETTAVVYKGKNLVTFIQERGDRKIRRSDEINIISRIPKLVYQFQLKWDGYGDLDLIAEIGDGNYVFYILKEYTGEGLKAVLDVDNRFSFGPENIRIYKAPRGSIIKVYVDYYINVPWKDKKWYHHLKNKNIVNYTLYVFDGFGKLIKTIKGKFKPTDASMLFFDKRLLGVFKVK